MKGAIDLEIHSWWHAGTGRGAGPTADAVVARTPEGLPFLPGKTVKGLVRGAVDLLIACDERGASAAEVEAWFGTELRNGVHADNRERALEERRFSTEPGALQFESAEVGSSPSERERWRSWAARPGRDGHPAHLFGSFSSTRVDASGVADDRALRTIELVVPLSLTAPVDGLSSRSWEALEAALPLLRSLGSHRNRGLGRVTATLRRAP